MDIGNFEKFAFTRTLFLQIKKVQILILTSLKNIDKGLLLLKNSSESGHSLAVEFALSFHQNFA